MIEWIHGNGVGVWGLAILVCWYMVDRRGDNTQSCRSDEDGRGRLFGMIRGFLQGVMKYGQVGW